MSQAEIDSLPLCRDLPSVTTRPSVLGALYVIEGSTLGGQMISRHLETTLGLRNGAGYGYFRSYGPDTPEKWREFRGILLAHSGPGVDDLIVSSAQNTFACLHRWFEAVLACAR